VAIVGIESQPFFCCCNNFLSFLFNANRASICANLSLKNSTISPHVLPPKPRTLIIIFIIPTLIIGRYSTRRSKTMAQGRGRRRHPICSAGGSRRDCADDFFGRWTCWRLVRLKREGCVYLLPWLWREEGAGRGSRMAGKGLESRHCLIGTG
jgi:hypothetical protein